MSFDEHDTCDERIGCEDDVAECKPYLKDEMICLSPEEYSNMRCCGNCKYYDPAGIMDTCEKHEKYVNGKTGHDCNDWEIAE